MLCGLGSRSSSALAFIADKHERQTAAVLLMERGWRGGTLIFLCRWKGIHACREKKRESEREFVGSQLLAAWPRRVDCSGKVWLGIKWFSVTEALSDENHQQHGPSWPRSEFYPVALTHSRVTAFNRLTAFALWRILKMKSVLGWNRQLWPCVCAARAHAKSG